LLSVAVLDKKSKK